MQYMEQIRVKSGRYEKQIQDKEFRWEDAVERLSGIRRSDHLKPVITIVIHWEGEPWNGPRSLHEMLEFEEEWMRQWVPDWPLFLLDAAAFDERTREKGGNCFQSDLGNVLHLVKCSADKKALQEIKKGRHEPIELSTAARRVVHAATGLKMPKAKEGKAEVNKVLKEFLDELKEEGIAEGKIEGRTETLQESIQNLLEETDWPLEEVMDKLKISEEEKVQYRGVFV